MIAERKPLKTIVLGAERTGKTALVKKYVHSTFSDEYDESFDGTEHKQILLEGQPFTLDIIPAEPAAEQVLCQTGDAFVVLYAINNRRSFNHIKQIHSQINSAKGGSLSRIPVFLVGTKADLDERQVSLEEGRQLAIELRCQKLFEISSKDHIGEIDDLFEKLVREALRMENSISTVQRPPMTPTSQSQPLTPTSQSYQATSPTSEAPRRSSNVFERLRFGTLKRKASFQSLTRKKSDSFGETVANVSRNQSRNDVRAVSYGNPTNTSGRPSVSTANSTSGRPTLSPVNSTSTKPATAPLPYHLDVDTSSWRDTIKWPTEIIPEEDIKAQ